jgi:prepilin-type N-terminal cleavage/methylation domain-containing protein
MVATKLKRKTTGRQSGFTIVEVLIVLAIAGLIMVVVFLAVPALQRSGRNNSLSSNARGVVAAVGNYMTNNSGAAPAAITFTSGTSVVIGAAGSNQETARLDNSVSAMSLNGAAITSSAGIGTLQIVTGTTAVCNTTATGLSATAGSPRSYVVLYVAESGSGPILKCVGS